MSLKDVTDLLPCEVARACFDRAYALAVRSCLPPVGVRFVDAAGEPWAGSADVVDALVPQFEVELRKAAGLEFCGVDLAECEGVAV